MTLALVHPSRGHITQFFGARQVDGNPHAGQDYAYSNGVEIFPEVYAAADGVVLFAGDARGLSWPNIMYLNPDFDRSDNVDTSAGKYTILAHYDPVGNRIALTGYGHQEEIWVKPGDFVRGRQQIGVCGETGFSAGKHVHFDLVLAPFDVDDAPFYGRVDPNPYFTTGTTYNLASGQSGTTTTPLSEEDDDDMQTVFRDTSSADPDKIYVGNALFHRHVTSPEQLADLQLLAREGKLKLFKDGEVQIQPLGCFGFNLDDFTARAVVDQPFTYLEPRTGQPKGTTTIANALGSANLQDVATRDEVEEEVGKLK